MKKRRIKRKKEIEKQKGRNKRKKFKIIKKG